MPVKGRMKEGELRVGKVQLDFLQQPIVISVVAGYVDPSLGNTYAWVETKGVQWSKETSVAMNAFLQALERDIARNVMTPSGAAATAASVEDGTSPSGIGERVRGNDKDAPQM